MERRVLGDVGLLDSPQGGTGQDSAVVSATADATAPSVTATYPTPDGVTGIGIGAAIRVTFSEPMDQADTAGGFSIITCGNSSCGTPGAALAGVTRWQAPNLLYFTPDATLAPTTWYGIKLSSAAGGVSDLAGNLLSQANCPHLSGSVCYRTFQTNSSLAPSGVLDAAPHPGATNVGTNARIVMSMSDPAPTTTEQNAVQGGFTLK